MSKKRIYQCLRLLLKFLLHKSKNKQVLIVNGKLLRIARPERALTQTIKRGLGGLSWGRRKRKLYSVYKNQQIDIDEKVFGVLVMAIIEENGKAVDLWFTEARRHEVKALQKLYEEAFTTVVI